MRDALPIIGRRAFLGAMAAWTLAPARQAAAAVEVRKAIYAVRTTLLYGVLRFEVNGVIDEAIDRQARRYEVRVAGRGAEMTSEIESKGVLLDGRWAPLRFHDHFVVYGRESNLEITYDHSRRAAEYHGRSETFLLGRLRSTDDVVTLPPGSHVDDVISAVLNYADNRWPAEPDGTLVTHVVRRRRTPGEGADDVDRAYRGEVVPFVLNLVPDPESTRPAAFFDLTGFTSWGREKEPARIIFGPDRRPEVVTASLILGTVVLSPDHTDLATVPVAPSRAPARWWANAGLAGDLPRAASRDGQPELAFGWPGVRPLPLNWGHLVGSACGSV